MEPLAFTDKCGRGRQNTFFLKGPWLFEGVEEFPELGFSQTVQIGEFEELGKALIINGLGQLDETGDKVYTRALGLPAMFSAPSRKKILIAGGGDGALARDILYFPQSEVREVKLIDISKVVVAETRRLIPSFWNGCQNDARLCIEHRDVFAYARATSERFNIVFYDLTDPPDEEYTPYAESSADHCYGKEALELFASILRDDGIFVMQAQELSLLRSNWHAHLRELLRKIYPVVHSYRVFVEFFGYWESFLIASKSKYWKPSQMSINLPLVQEVSPKFGIERRQAIEWAECLSSLFILPLELKTKLA